jgi:hypothetical protein
MQVEEVEKHKTDLERQYKSDASKRSGKARNGGGKGNPKLVQV